MKKKISPKNRDYYESIVPEIDNLKKNGLINSYIGNKGYSIYKISLNDDIIEFIKKELTVKPFMQSSIVQPNSFPIYLESDKKIYVPRFWGINIFGNPKTLKIKMGKSIDLKFNGELRDYQKTVMDSYLKAIKFGSKEEENSEGSALIELGCGMGKCMGIDTPIMMYNGDIKMVQDIKVGDQLMGDDSTPRNVLSLARGREMMYDIIPIKGDKYTVNESHILSLKSSVNKSAKYKKNEIIDMPLLDYLNLPKSYHGRAGCLLGYRVGVEFTPKDVDIEPYYLGLWLGDGTSRTTGITTVDNCVIDYINEYSERLNSRVVICDSNRTRCCTYSIVNSSTNKENNFKGNNKLLNMLKNHNLLLNKHIPKIYKCNSRQVRLELLAGIIDSDGSAENGGYDIIQKNETLLDDIIYVARSLGFAAYKKECKKSCMYKGEKKEGVYYRTNIHGKGLEDIPVKCERKKVEPRRQIKDALNTRIKVEKREIDNYYGFELDGNRRYLLGDYTVTHNTVLGLKIVEVIKKKTIIFVHKTFLKNQWIERIKQYLPDARIGCVQGQVIDIEEKDIVIAMIQSISMKSYPDSLFDDFGLSIYDECFPSSTLIHTSKGKKRISMLYEIWEKYGVNNDIEILSFNRIKKIFEYKPLNYAWQKQSKNLIKFKLSKQIIECTINHKILTNKGYIEADKLNIGDIILSKYDIQHKDNLICPCLNDDQLQIVYGSYLGDGCILKTKKDRYRLKIIHCKEQKSYCEWKANMFGITKLEYIEKNGYSQKEAYRFCSKCFDMDNSLADNRNEIPDWLIEKIDARGIAIWFMDDGSVTKKVLKDNNISYFAKISSNNYDYINHNKIQAIFRKFNIETKIYKTRTYYEISFNKENSIKLFDLIRNYNHSNMDYKLNSVSNNKYIWNNEFLEYGSLKITKKEYITKLRDINVYDIEVKDNHNFIIATGSQDTNYIDGPIVSNCHHISSETFSNCLRKCTTLYGLGLSATMNRKDGLTNVFKMYLGDICNKQKKKVEEDNVLVKAIDYNVYDDDEYNEVERDFRGNVKHTTMLSKVSNFNYRTDFIINVIENELKINKEQQIILLGHQKNLLNYIYKVVELKNLTSVGYYIGGMKEKDLKASESKQLILATYAMAAEGLDIPSLTTLILATPKSDIVQSVGRILREKHSNPLIIDIIDQHDCFINQFAKRKAFYNEKNYKIIRTNNERYIDYIKYIKKGEEFDEEEIWKEVVVKSKKSKENKCLIKI